MVQTTRRNVIGLLGAGMAANALGMPSYAFARSAPYKIGFVGALSGPSESLGIPMLEGTKIAVEQINAAGGVNRRQLELAIRDSKGKPDVGTVAARELVGEGCTMLVGVVSSAVALAMSAILQQLDAVLITCAAHSNRLTHENFNKHYFRITDNPPMRMRGFGQIMAKLHPDVPAWGGLIPDHEYGRSTWEAFSHAIPQFYERIGKAPKVSEPILTPYGGNDYRNNIAAAMRDKGMGFFCSMYGGDAITAYTQAKPYGFFERKKPFLDSANEFIVARVMKRDLPEMWLGGHWYFGGFKGNPISDLLYETYRERTGNACPDGWVAEGQAAILAYVEALKKAPEGSAAGLIPALEGLSFDSATGMRTIRSEDHQTIKNLCYVLARGADNEAGFQVIDSHVLDGAALIEPPTPGGPIRWS